MDVHKNAPLTPCGREATVRRVVEGGQTPKAVSEAVGVCPRTVRSTGRAVPCGRRGRPRRDRSSRPHHLRCPTPPRSSHGSKGTGASAGRACADREMSIRVSKATVSRILRRLGLNRLKALEPAEPVRRYEREHPGELIHIDIKKLGKIGSIGHRITGRQTGVVNRHLGIGWEFVHVCIDDASRVAFSRVMKDEKKDKRRRLPQSRRCLLCEPRREGRARHDRQWVVLPFQSLRPSL